MENGRNEHLTKAQVKKLIEAGKTNEQIAKEGKVYVEVVDRLRRDIENEQRKNIKHEIVIQMAKKLETVQKIVEATGYSKDSIYMIIRNEGIYTRTKVAELIKAGKTNEEIAKEGNVYVEAVDELRIELEIEEHEKYESEAKANMKDTKHEIVIEMAKKSEPVEKIVEVTGYSKDTIYLIIRNEGIYTRTKVAELIKAGKTNEEISKEGNVYIEAIEKLRMKIENREKLKGMIASVEKMDITDLLPDRRNFIIAMLGKRIPIEQISAKTRVPISVINEVKEKLQNTGRKKNISPERKAVNLRIKMLELRGMIKALREVTAAQTTVIDFKIQSLMKECKELLNSEDYAFLAFAYTKIREYQKAIEIGEQYLGLEDSKLSALSEKIFEITGKDEQSILPNSTPTKIGTDR